MSPPHKLSLLKGCYEPQGLARSLAVPVNLKQNLKSVAAVRLRLGDSHTVSSLPVPELRNANSTPTDRWGLSQQARLWLRCPLEAGYAGSAGLRTSSLRCTLLLS